jgi:predicted Zn-dependent protease
LNWQKIFIAIATCLVILLGWQEVKAQKINDALPPLQVRPLPASLAQWRSPSDTGDYFAKIQSTDAGYLIWSEFPIKIYIERSQSLQNHSAEARRGQQWISAVLEGIEAWKPYLPIQEVEQARLADIIIQRKQPPLGVSINRDTGKIERLRARSAQTQYEFYVSEGNRPRLSHRMTILISPGLSPQSILNATRHELGHALGIWGHSPFERDMMYFSQVRTPPAISPRDINTLKKIYQQPTRLGWEIKKIQSLRNKLLTESSKRLK